MIKDILVIILLLILIVILITSDFGSEGRTYDCRLAEIHPDIPPDVKEECRRLNYEYFKKQSDEERLRKFI